MKPLLALRNDLLGVVGGAAKGKIAEGSAVGEPVAAREREKGRHVKLEIEIWISIGADNKTHKHARTNNATV